MLSLLYNLLLLLLLLIYWALQPGKRPSIRYAHNVFLNSILRAGQMFPGKWLKTKYLVEVNGDNDCFLIIESGIEETKPNISFLGQTMVE